MSNANDTRPDSDASAPRFAAALDYAYIPAHPDPAHPEIMLAGEWVTDADELADFRDRELAVMAQPHPDADLAAYGGKVIPLPEGHPTWADVLDMQSRVLSLEARLADLGAMVRTSGALFAAVASGFDPGLRIGREGASNGGVTHVE